MINRKGIYTMQASLLLLGSLGFATSAWSSQKCEKVFNTLEMVKALSPSYADDFLLNLKERYEVKEVAPATPITNQGRRGFCHMYSLYTEMVREYRQRNNGQDPNISIYYWAYHHWLNRAINTALDPKNGTSIQEGGWYESTFDLIKSVGVMTNEQWAAIGGKTDIETRYKDSMETPLLQHLMVEKHNEIELLNTFLDLHKELYKLSAKEQREKLKEIFNDPKNNYLFTELKKFVKNKLEKVDSGHTEFDKKQLSVLADLADRKNRLYELSPSEISGIKNALSLDVKKDVKTMYASIFFGKSETPNEAINLENNIKKSKEMFPEMHQATITLSVDEDNRQFGKVQAVGRQKGVNGDHLYLQGSTELLAELVVDQIDNGNGVWIGYDHNDNFVDAKSGAMTIRGLYYSPNKPYHSRNLRNREGLYEGGHAVQLVGYIRDKVTGKIVGFKMQNSWGTEVGQAGYFTMDMDYFRAFIWRVSIRDEKGQIAANVKSDRGTTQVDEKGYFKKPVELDSATLLHSKK